MKNELSVIAFYEWMWIGVSYICDRKNNILSHKNILRYLFT